MSEKFTPSINALRHAYVAEMVTHTGILGANHEFEDAFNRAIEAIKREAAASVIETLLDEFDPSEINQERLEQYAAKLREGKTEL